ncbi:uncharacterized protein LOC141673536 [Apium graveolens]|uniref:uncharacterized protein LOC141673536 n=1 Tax=Apium graveolens TaxID=4045 RepID=UPI003D78EE93
MTTSEPNKSKENAVGLNYPMLTKTNYAAWSMKMKVFMQTHGVWEAIEPKNSKETLEEKIDKLALAAIMKANPWWILEDVLLSLAEKNTTKDACEAIKVSSLGADRVKQAKAQTLKGEFESLNMKETDQLDDFCIKLNGLVTNIRALGEKVEESYVVKKLLRAVPTKFLQIASAIEQFGNLEVMSVEEVIGSLKAHEERLRGSGECRKSRKEKEARDSKPEVNLSQVNDDEPTLLLVECGDKEKQLVLLNEKKIIPNLVSETECKPEVNLSQVNDDEPTLLLVECGDKEKQLVLLNEKKIIPNLVSETECKRDLNIWYLDNGASNHMMGERSKFKNLDERILGQVKFGDRSTVKIKGKGFVSFVCKNGEVRTLKDVYFIPTLRNNIISLGQLSEAGNKVILEGDHLWVYEKSGTLLLRVKRTMNRLYKVMLECDEGMCLLSKSEEKTWLWHVRLGHVNFQAMQQMSKNGMAHEMPEFYKPKEVCKGCLLSKQTRKSFPVKTEFLAKGARSLLKERNMPSYFWGEAVRHAVYVLNRSPTRALPMQTPYESWTCNKPNFEYLRVFGCLGHMKFPAIHTTKLSDRSKEVIYLGKESGTKACRLFDLSVGTIHVSRDVIFEEGKGWNWSEGEIEGVSVSNMFTIIGVPESSQADTSDENGENTVSTPLSSTGSASINNSPSRSNGSVDYGSETSSDSSEPRRFRLLSDIYDTTEVVEAEDELLLSEIEEPVSYEQATKEKAWRVAMENEIEDIESKKI